MADGGQYSQQYTVYSDQFGPLVLADSFVRRLYEPKCLATQLYVEQLRERLGLTVKGPASALKVTRCISDFLVAARFSKTGLITWPASNSEYKGAPYGADIMRKVRKALLGEYLSEVQASSKNDRIARVYQVDKTIASASLSFSCHGLGNTIKVRSSKRKTGGRVYGGQQLPFAQFKPHIVNLEQVVKKINQCMTKHPLETLTGQEFGFCCRIFNDGRLNVGGRLYGGWQCFSEEERLLSLIDFEPVCEIDFKASYISIANVLVGTGADLGVDPYQKIEFVRKERGSDRANEMRKLAKLLVSSFISQANKQGSCSFEMTQFPKGKVEMDEAIGSVRRIPMREKFRIPVGLGVRDYIADILAAFPFLQDVGKYQGNIMFIESEIVVGALSKLAGQGIVAYPVHDCLLVKISDKDQAIKALHESQIEMIGRCLNMDVTYPECLHIESSQILSGGKYHPNGQPQYKHLSALECVDDDFEVIETF